MGATGGRIAKEHTVGVPAAAVAAGLWRTRQEITEQFLWEIQRLRSEGYMLSEIARACGIPRRTLQQLISTVRQEHGSYGPAVPREEASVPC